MKQLIFLLLVFIVFPAFTQQQTFRLHVQPGMEKMKGDGDETTTIVVTARDEQGDILQKSGIVNLQVNAGRLSYPSVSMRNGVAVVSYTAPILDNESKAFQRSIQLTFAVIRQLMGMSAGDVTGKDAKKKMYKVAVDTARVSRSTAAMASVTGKDPVVRIIAELNGVKGKASINIEKVKGATPTRVASGYYEGRYVTGQSCSMTIRASGKGFSGIMKAGRDRMTVECKGETKGGFLVVYVFDEQEMKLLKKGNPNMDYLGFPTAAKILPGNTIYFLAPPIYFSRKGASEPGQKTSGAKYDGDWIEEPQASAALVAKQNMLPGDGESETQLAFIYRDKKGRPKAGVPVRLQLGRGGMGGILIQPNGTTDSKGVFRCRYRAPLFKTNDFQELGTCKRDIVWAYYRDEKKEKYITSTVGILRCTDAKLILDKPGFEEKSGLPIVIASPRGTIEGTILARVKRPYGYYDESDVPIGYAKVRITGGAIAGHESTFEGETDKNGRLKLELKYQNWPVYFSHKLEAPYIYPFSEIHKKRRDSLGKNLYMFPDKGFQARAGQQVYTMELGVVQEPTEVAKAYEAKFQLMGDLMATYWMSEKLVSDTTGEVISHGWSLLGMIWDWADKKFKFGKKVKGAAREGSIADMVFKSDEVGSKSIKRMIFQKFNAIVTRNQKSSWGKAAVVAMDHANAKIFSGLKQLLGFLADYLSKVTGSKFPQNPIPDQIKQEVLFHYRGQTMPHMERFLVANPQAVLDAYDDVQPWLVKNSGNLRNHYQNVAWTRLVVEEAKAWKDLTVDLSQGLAIGLAVGAGQVWALKWWDKFKKFSDMLDKAYAGSAFLGELYTCSSLMTECQELFVHTNRAIGAVDDPLVQQKQSLLAVAYADQSDNRSHVAPPAIFTVDIDDLQLRNDTIPTASVRRLVNSYIGFLDWEKKVDSVWMLAMDKSEVEDFVEARESYADAMETLAVITAVADDQTLETGLQERWEDLLDELEDRGKRIDKYASRAYQRGLQRQTAMVNDDRQFEIYVKRKPGKSLMGGNRRETPWQMIVISGAGLLIVVAFVIVGIKWKSGRKRASKSDSNPLAINSGSIPSAPRLLIPGGDEIPLKGSTVTIGSQTDNQIVLPYADVLPCHAVLHIGETGDWWIEPGGNGGNLEVNGEIGQSFRLSHGTRIRLGSAELFFLIS